MRYERHVNEIITMSITNKNLLMSATVSNHISIEIDESKNNNFFSALDGLDYSYYKIFKGFM